MWPPLTASRPGPASGSSCDVVPLPVSTLTIGVRIVRPVLNVMFSALVGLVENPTLKWEGVVTDSVADVFPRLVSGGRFITITVFFFSCSVFTDGFR